MLALGGALLHVSARSKGGDGGAAFFVGSALLVAGAVLVFLPADGQ